MRPARHRSEKVRRAFALAVIVAAFGAQAALAQMGGMGGMGGQAAWVGNR